MASLVSHTSLPFELSIRWPDIYGDLVSGDEALVRQAVTALEQRDRDLEDFLARVKRPQTWNHTGPLTVSEGDDWPVDTPFSPNLFVTKLKVYGASSTVQLVLNGSTVLAELVLTDALPHSVQIDNSDLRLEPFVDWLHTEITVAGAGSEGCVASVYGV